MYGNVSDADMQKSLLDKFYHNYMYLVVNAYTVVGVDLIGNML